MMSLLGVETANQIGKHVNRSVELTNFINTLQAAPIELNRNLCNYLYNFFFN